MKSFRSLFIVFAALIAVVASAMPGHAAPGEITTFAGTGVGGYSGNGGLAIYAQLTYPAGVAVDSAGNVYIADTANNCIRKVATDGVITTVAGNSTAAFSGDGGQAILASLDGPQGVTVDSIGNIYISDSNNRRIRKVGTDGVIQTVAGNGSAGFSGDGGQATAASFSGVWHVTVDSIGNLYIPDRNNNRIRKVGTDGVITTIAGVGGAAYLGDGGQAILAYLNQPSDVEIDSLGNLYIADYGNSRIRKIAANGIITTFAGNGYGYYGDGGPAINAGMRYVRDVAIDAIGNVYIMDEVNYSVRKVGTDGVITTFAGTGINGFSGDGGPATSGTFNATGVAVDPLGNVYIADKINNRIRKVQGVTANGTYAWDSGTGVLAITTANSSFVCDGLFVGTDNQTGVTVTADTMSSAGGNWPTWTRSPVGAANDPVGVWTFSDGGSGNSYTLTINGDNTFSLAAVMVACSGGGGGGSGFSAGSQHWDNGYYIHFNVNDPTHQYTAVAVSGPYVSTVGTSYVCDTGYCVDLVYDAGMGNWVSWSNGSSISFGLTYPLDTPLIYTFKDGATVIGTDNVEAFIEPLPMNISPTGTISTIPTFTWDYVSGGYGYAVEMHDSTGNMVWSNYNVPVGSTSTPYAGPALTEGMTYNYNVSVRDTYGNSSYAQGSFTYQTIFTLTINTTGTGTGTVTGAGAYALGSVVNLTATPDAFSFFAGWSGPAGCVGGQVTMNSDMTCTATFTSFSTYTITLNTTGTGTGTVTGAGTYIYGTVINLTATPDAGSTFAGWSGPADCASGQIYMNGDIACTAQFTAVGSDIFDGAYTGSWDSICPSCGDTAAGTFSTTLTNGVFTNTIFTVTSGTHGILFTSGTVFSSGNISGYGDTPPQCSSSAGTFTGQIIVSSGVPVMTMTYSRTASVEGCAAETGTIAATRTITYALTTNTTGTGAGTVTGAGTYNTGAAVSLTATPNAGSVFMGWSGDADCYDGVVTMNADKTCAASFRLLVTTATLTASPVNSQVAGNPVDFTSTATDGSGNYEYKFWLKTGTVWAVRQGYSPSNIWTWDTTSAAPGVYSVLVYVRNVGSVAAYDVMKSLSYTIASVQPATAVTLVASPSTGVFTAGASVGFTSAASGGTGTYEYQFWLRTGTTWSITQGYTPLNSWTWDTTSAAPGTYYVKVYARNVGSVAAYEAIRSLGYTIVSATPATSATLTPSATGIQLIGTTISFTGAASGGSGPYEYQFWLKTGSTWAIVQNYSTLNAWVWYTAAPGIYTVKVYARNVGSAAAYEAAKALSYTLVSAAPATAATLVAGPVSPQVVGTALTFTAGASGGTGTYEYQFWFKSGTVWTMVQDYSAANTLYWGNAGPSGIYTIKVYARNVGSVAAYEAAKAVSYTLVDTAPATGATLSASPVSPKPAGTLVGFTAAGSGGGSGVYEYQFWLKTGSTWAVVQSYGASNVYAWDTTGVTPGAYTVMVYVRNAGSPALYEVTKIRSYTIQ